LRQEFSLSGNLVEGPSSAVAIVEKPPKPDPVSTSGLRYRPILALGHGGMADVLLSVGRGPGGFHKLVVLKTMRKELLGDEDLREMFLAEARLSARLNHSNVVQVYEVVDTALPCIVMEYLEGQPMSVLQRAAGDAFTLPMQLKVISESLTGLHYSHELKDYDGTPLNIVHRDVSPQNIFITYDGVVKVLDFGIAKASDATNQTRAGVIKGKITYMPREQMLAENVDRRADVYAIGCMLWHAAAGAKMWADMAEGEVMRALMDGKIPKPSQIRPVDPKLENIIMKALAPEPEARHATALELRLAIDEYLASTSPTTSMRDVGTLVSSLFAEQQEARKKQVHLALTAPHSEPPPPIPDGLEPIIRSATGNSAYLTIDRERKHQAIWTLSAAMVAAILAIAGTFAFFTWRGSRNDSNPSATAAPAKIQIHLAAMPAGATLAVDGRTLAENPAVLAVMSDDRDHEVTATLAGYATFQKTVRFERDLSLDIMLQPSVSAAPASASASQNASDSQNPKSSSGKGARSGQRASGAGVPAVKNSHVNCTPPFYFENGIKVYKPECI
jgi:serine/threonine-protein kinase